MNEHNDFESQVEQEERAQAGQEPDIEVEVEFTPDDEAAPARGSEIVDKIKELVKKGNVTKIIVKRGDNTIVNIPLNAGIVGGLLGVAAAPWAVVIAAVAAAGLDCRVELEKNDGQTVSLRQTNLSRKVRDAGSAVMGGLREAAEVFRPEQSAEADFESVVDETAAEAAPEEPPTVEIPVEDGTQE